MQWGEVLALAGCMCLSAAAVWAGSSQAIARQLVTCVWTRGRWAAAISVCVYICTGCGVVRAVCGSALHVAAGGVKVFLPKMVPLCVCVCGHWRSECVWLQHMLCKSMLAKCVLSNSHGAVLAFGVVSCSQHRHWCCRLAAVRFVCSVPGCLVIHPTCWRSLIADCDSLHSCQQSGRHMDMASGLAG